MDAKKIKDTRQRLSSEYENLTKSIDRRRLAAQVGLAASVMFLILAPNPESHRLAAVSLGG